MSSVLDRAHFICGWSFILLPSQPYNISVERIANSEILCYDFNVNEIWVISPRRKGK